MGKNEFTVKVGDKVLTLKTINITPDIRLESNKFFGRAFNEALAGGYQLKIEAERMLEAKGLLDTKADEKKLADVRKTLRTMEVELRKGMVGTRRMTKQEGKELALRMKDERAKLSSIGSALNEYFNNTAESYAENERLQYYIYACTVFSDTGVKYWKSYDAFKSEENNELVNEATKGFLSVVGGIDRDYEKKFYENVWLQRFGFMNELYQLVDEKGRLINRDGKLIDKEGRFIDENGAFVDNFGNPIDESGTLLVEDSWAEKTPENKDGNLSPT